MTLSGLEIWRIEKLQSVPVPRESHGRFFTGDSYVILKTTALKNGSFRHNIHYWLGKDTTQDEAGTAAIKTGIRCCSWWPCCSIPLSTRIQSYNSGSQGRDVSRHHWGFRNDFGVYNFGCRFHPLVHGRNPRNSSGIRRNVIPGYIPSSQRHRNRITPYLSQANSTKKIESVGSSASTMTCRPAATMTCRFYKTDVSPVRRYSDFGLITTTLSVSHVKSSIKRVPPISSLAKL
ncbi:hypothetical protein GUJ93_ZPchr0006g45688 [Zizania palustris]|uniref:Gelsolin-like domain-containing protein n=1 Tax=Zizania palustris TaxID=103762 RepID=A0A8J5VWN6_ZIZPA|nr:hypothetical protein GUJ93_ZPchr0006g45688 [Zizania palustris]